MSTHFKFTFIEWLTLLSPNCKLRITTENGHIYENKSREGLNFEMNLVGFDLNSIIKKNKK